MRRATMNPGEKAGAKPVAATEEEVVEVAEAKEDVDKPLEAKPLPVPKPAAAMAATESKLMPPIQPQIEQYVVSNHNGRNVMLQGGMVLLRQGKVVDSLNYDIEYLKSQGVQLQPYGK